MKGLPALILILCGAMVLAADPSQELQIQLSPSPTAFEANASAVDGSANTSPPSTQQMDVLSSKQTNQPSARQRAPQVSENHLIVLAVNASGEELYREIILDPRLIRSELTGDDELGDKTEFYLDEVLFSLTLPDDADIAEIRLLKPRWTGSEFISDLVASARVP